MKVTFTKVVFKVVPTTIVISNLMPTKTLVTELLVVLLSWAMKMKKLVKVTELNMLVLVLPQALHLA
ncbi:hypothetical protein D3C76_1163160 [compost metagenome]